MQVKEFFDKATSTMTYVLVNEASEAIIIDPVLDFDVATGVISTESVELIVNFLDETGASPLAVLETHVHADHITGAAELRKRFPGIVVGISKRVTEVQETFKPVFNLDELKTDGSQFQFLFEDWQKVEIGEFEFQVIPTPGHTPACSSYLFGKHLFTGDAIFMPDSGVGRCDFPKGNARDLFKSIASNVFSLPDDTMVYVGHDYQPNGRDLEFRTPLATQKESNVFLNQTTTEDDFVTRREERDKTLAAPKLLLPSLQVNLFAGELPKATASGQRFLKLPLKIKQQNG